MSHLIGLGHRRIAYLGGPNVSHGSRFEVYRRTMLDVAPPFDTSVVRATDLTLEAGHHAMRDLLTMPNPPTAVFCIDDLVAIGALQAAKEAQYRVPEDLSIVGFDDDVYARLVQPPLSTVAQPSFELGRSAARRALLRLQTASTGEVPDTLPKETIRLPCELVVRGSTAPAPPARTDSPVGTPTSSQAGGGRPRGGEAGSS
jgi:LacI family transcriptional regulator